MRHREQRIVLFLCTGNYYRSRFAEVLFNFLAGQMEMPWRATSRALALERGINNIGPMAVSAIEVLEDLGVCIGEECARAPAQVTTQDLETADQIIALKHAEHLPLLQERYPPWADTVEYWHIDDTPEVLPLIEREVRDLVARLCDGDGRQGNR
jgi:protein-tyrosine-phosphatase